MPEKPRHELSRDDRRKGAEKAAEAKRAKKEAERAALSETRLEQLDAALERLAPAAEAAAVTIALLLKAESEAVRLRAAIATLEILEAPSLREMSDRLSRLEEIANAMRTRRLAGTSLASGDYPSHGKTTFSSAPRPDVLWPDDAEHGAAVRAVDEDQPVCPLPRRRDRFHHAGKRTLHAVDLINAVPAARTRQVLGHRSILTPTA